MDSELSLSPQHTDRCENCRDTCSWSLKRKLEEIEHGGKGDSIHANHSTDIPSIARVDIEFECIALREALSRQQQSIQELLSELEEERNASSSAASEAMSMIIRLQREKAEIQLESRQFKRFADEKMEHDQQEIFSLEELLYKKDQMIQSLSGLIQTYRQRLMSLGFNEGHMNGQKSNSRNQTDEDEEMNCISHDYPPLKCKPNDNNDSCSDVNLYSANDTPSNVTRYGFDDETPRDLMMDTENQEYRVYHLDRSPCHGTKIGVVDVSPRPTHGSRFSSNRSSSFNGRFTSNRSSSFNGRVKETASPILNGKFNRRKEFSRERDCFRQSNDMDDALDLTEDRVYTIDSIQSDVTETKNANSTRSESSMARYNDESGAGELKSLYTRLQALEADRESMKHAIVSMTNDKARLVLLREIAQNLSKEVYGDKRKPNSKKPPITSIRGNRPSFVSLTKSIISLVSWRKRVHQNSRYMSGISSSNNSGLLLVLDKAPRSKYWTCLARRRLQN